MSGPSSLILDNWVRTENGIHDMVCCGQSGREIINEGNIEVVELLNKPLVGRC